MSEQKHAGRPRKPPHELRNADIRIPVTAGEKRRIMAAVKLEAHTFESLAEWSRSALMASADYVFDEHGIEYNDTAPTQADPTQTANHQGDDRTVESMSKENTKAALDAAIWVTASPHEWVWTLEQQCAMARYCLLAAAVLSETKRDLEKVVCTKEPDDGVILLSGEGPTHFDPDTQCQVYDHDHFSPLGDALIAIHKNVSDIVIAKD